MPSVQRLNLIWRFHPIATGFGRFSCRTSKRRYYSNADRRIRWRVSNMYKYNDAS